MLSKWTMILLALSAPIMSSLPMHLRPQALASNRKRLSRPPKRRKSEQRKNSSMKTIREAIKFVQSLTAAVRTADANGAAVDTLGYNTACLIVNAGTIDLASTDETYIVKVQEADTSGGSYTDVTGASVSITANDQVKSVEVPSLGTSRKRFLRAVLDVGGT